MKTIVGEEIKPCLTDWLAWLETLHYKVIDLGLERISRVAELMGITTPAPIVVTVTGTNGKGTCVTHLADIYKSAGYKVGAYTSPHLFVFNERIQIQQNPVSDELICASLMRVEQHRNNISLTYFEYTTLAALDIFNTANLDVVVLEVGLGGRLDAVNIIDPDVAVITSIDIDHSEFLGDTREAIGYEKSGIMRYQKPVVIGQNNVPNSVLAQATKLGAPVYISSNVVSQVIDLLQKQLPVTQNAITIGLNNFCLPGRYQRFLGSVEKIFDVAHNPAASQLLAHKLTESAALYKKTHVVVGILNDKDHMGILGALKNVADCWYVAGLSGKRGTKAASLAMIITKITGDQPNTYDTVTEAYHAAIMAAHDGDRIVAYGSFLTVAEAMKTVT